jgi:hypothetical protein
VPVDKLENPGHARARDLHNSNASSPLAHDGAVRQAPAHTAETDTTMGRLRAEMAGSLPSVVTWHLPSIEVVVLLEIGPNKLLVQSHPRQADVEGAVSADDSVEEWCFPAVRMPVGRASQSAEVVRRIEQGLGLGVDVGAELPMEPLPGRTDHGSQDYSGPCRLYRARAVAVAAFKRCDAVQLKAEPRGASVESAPSGGADENEVLMEYMSFNQEVAEAAAVQVGQLHSLEMPLMHRRCRLACWRSFFPEATGGIAHRSHADGNTCQAGNHEPRWQDGHLDTDGAGFVGHVAHERGLQRSNKDSDGDVARQKALLGPVCHASTAASQRSAMPAAAAANVAQRGAAAAAANVAQRGAVPFLVWVARTLLQDLERERRHGRRRVEEASPDSGGMSEVERAGGASAHVSARLAAAKYLESQLPSGVGLGLQSAFESGLVRVLESCTDAWGAGDKASGHPETHDLYVADASQAGGACCMGDGLTATANVRGLDGERDGLEVVRSAVAAIVREAVATGGITFTASHLRARSTLEVAPDSCILTRHSAKRQLFLRRSPGGCSRAITVASYFAEAHRALQHPG